MADGNGQVKRDLLANIEATVIVKPGAFTRIYSDLGKNDVIGVGIAVAQIYRIMEGVRVNIIATRTECFGFIPVTERDGPDSLRMTRLVIVIEWVAQLSMPGIERGHKGNGFVD